MEKKTYPAPKVGTVVTEENVEAFIERFPLWLIYQGGDDSEFLRDRDGLYLTFNEVSTHDSLPYKVMDVQDTDEIIWVQEEF